MSEQIVPADAESLAFLATKVLPAPIIQFASGGKLARLMTHFDWMPNCYEFGERLVLITGLAESALYVQRLLHRKETVERDARVVDHLKKLFFEWGYDRGLAITIVERFGSRPPKSMQSLLTAGKPDLTFIKSRPVGAGHVLQEQGSQPVQPALFKLIENFAFLRHIEFIPGRPETRLAGKPIELRPFLLWDGLQLELLVNLNAGDPPEGVYHSIAAEGLSKHSTMLDIGLRLRLSRLAEILGGPTDFLAIRADVTQEPLSRSQSLLPLIAGTFPKIQEFAERVYDMTNAGTRLALWCRPASPDEKTAISLVEDETFVVNQIIRECMEKDPVYVLERYFQREEIDPYEWLDWSVQGQEFAEVQNSVSAYKGRLAPFYPDRVEEVNRQVELFKARLLAQRVARKMEFQIDEQRSVDDIADYMRRVWNFRRYLESGKAKQEELKSAFMEICCSAEEILRFLCTFYEAVRVYDPNYSDGLGDAGKRHIAKIEQEIATLALGEIAHHFVKMGRDRELQRCLDKHGGRNGIWPIESETRKPAVFSRLFELNDYRNVVAHKTGVVLGDIQSFVDEFLVFLEWLTNAKGSLVTPWRIYPELLALHVVTQNRCGVTSVRYILKEFKFGNEQQINEQEITLYTNQGLGNNAGFFYALPDLRKVHESLWVDPILIPIGELHGQT